MSHEYELAHRAPPSAPPQTANPKKRGRTRGGKGRREKREKKLLAQAEALATANPSPSNLEKNIIFFTESKIRERECLTRERERHAVKALSVRAPMRLREQLKTNSFTPAVENHDYACDCLKCIAALYRPSVEPYQRGPHKTTKTKRISN